MEPESEPPQVIDFELAGKNVPGGDRVLRELASLFLGECPRLLKELKNGVEKDDVTSAQRAAHTLKSNATIFAATPLAEKAARIEKLCAVDRFEEVPSLVPAVETAGNRVCQAIRQWLAKE